jgi:hypothetical protein
MFFPPLEATGGRFPDELISSCDSSGTKIFHPSSSSPLPSSAHDSWLLAVSSVPAKVITVQIKSDSIERTGEE